MSFNFENSVLEYFFLQFDFNVFSETYFSIIYNTQLILYKYNINYFYGSVRMGVKILKSHQISYIKIFLMMRMMSMT